MAHRADILNFREVCKLVDAKLIAKISHGKYICTTESGMRYKFSLFNSCSERVVVQHLLAHHWMKIRKCSLDLSDRK